MLRTVKVLENQVLATNHAMLGARIRSSLVYFGVFKRGIRVF